MLEKFYRLASVKEVAFYEGRLYPLQDDVFDVVSAFGDSLYLTGGTALARFHFHHRLSDDLDFFTQDAQLPFMANELMARLQQRHLAVETEQVSPWFVRFHVIDGALRLKVDMVRDAQLTGDLTRLPQGIYTNSVADIGANKITAFEDRAEIKDIIDLFYICRTIGMPELFALADHKRVPVAYEHLLTVNQHGVSGRALITDPIAPEGLEGFLEKLRLATEAEVKKKVQAAQAESDQIIASLLWDFPQEERALSRESQPVLRRRLRHLSLPHRRVVESLLNS